MLYVFVYMLYVRSITDIVLQSLEYFKKKTCFFRVCDLCEEFQLSSIIIVCSLSTRYLLFICYCCCCCVRFNVYDTRDMMCTFPITCTLYIFLSRFFFKEFIYLFIYSIFFPFCICSQLGNLAALE